MSAFVGELIGTMILIILGGGVVGGAILKETKAEGAGWGVITIGWGLGVTMAIYAVGGISGAHLNPAITIGFAFVGDFPWSEVPIYIMAQMIGAFIGATIVFLQYLPHWKKTRNQSAILSVFSTSPAIRSPLSNLVSEMIGTFVLVMGLMVLGENQFTDGLNPIIVGLLITAIGMSLGPTTGYAINPARDLGPRIAHAILPITGKGNSEWNYAWIPVIGPILGGIYGAFFYKALFKGDFTLLFWTFSAVVAIIILGALRRELV
ncbi:MAG: MIP/aquaporin family protein [Niallia nealsonii]|nr:MIP/aquaporin family protein [Niallia nealsonii]